MDYLMDPCIQSDTSNHSVSCDEAGIHTLCPERLADFDSWTSRIAEIEKSPPVEAEAIFSAYDSFLSEFPLCYGYWRKYAGHKARLCSVDKVVEVYERAVQSATYSVDLWVDYCSFSMLLFEDPADVRRLFERGISFVGKDYLCYLLWDKFIEFEFSQKQWSSLAHIYIRTLSYPTKKLGSYYNSFRKLATIWEEEIEALCESAHEMCSEAAHNVEVTEIATYDEEDISIVIKCLLEPAAGKLRHKALHKYLSIGEHLYQKAREMDEKICCFETRIRRSYFHVRPLDVDQLKNWHHYLDFVEIQGDFDWTVKLYERCLVPCANYLEFWMRYVDFMETKGGREIASFALVRATQIFLKRIPAAHLFCARYKEKAGEVYGSRAAFQQCDSNVGSNFIEIVTREANMEKRLGNPEAAFNVYEKAIGMARERQKAHTVSMLYVHFSRFKYMVTGCIDAARDILNKGVQHFPCCKILLEGLLNFEMMHRGPKRMNVIDSIVSNAIFPGSHMSQGLSNKDREDISNQYLEFVDHCGTIHDVMKAWNRHRKFFPHQIRLASYNYMSVGNDMDIAQPHHASGDDNCRGSIRSLELEQKSSLPQNPGIQPEHAITGERHLADINSQDELLQSLGSPVIIEQSGEDLIKQGGDTDKLVDEVSENGEALDGAVEYSEEANKVQTKENDDPSYDLGPPSLKNLSLSSQGDEIQNSTTTRTTSSYSDIPVASPRPIGSKQHNDHTTSGVSSLSCLTCMESENSVQVHDSCPSHLPTNPSLMKMQPSSQPLVASLSEHNFGGGGDCYAVNYTRPTVGSSSCGIQGYPQIQQPPQLQGSPHQLHQSSAVYSPTPRVQSFNCPPQPFQNPPVQLGNQAPNQYQVGVSQVQPLSSPLWPVQNMQQQYFSPAARPQVQSQLSSPPAFYTQAQVHQYQQQNNIQYVQHGNQGYSPYMWHYYYPPQQQQQPEQNQQPQVQHQQYHQQMTPFQMQAWNSNYYQQQVPLQHYGNSPYQNCQQQVASQQASLQQQQHYGSSYYEQESGQQPVVSQVQGATEQNIDTSVSSELPYPQQHPPPN